MKLAKKSSSRLRITKDDHRGGGTRKKTNVTIKNATANTTAKARHHDVPHRASKYVGVFWKVSQRKWKAHIEINGKRKSLGLSDDEKEAARMYDEQAALLGKPVNFPLHEGMEQAVKMAPRGAGR